MGISSDSEGKRFLRSPGFNLRRVALLIGLVLCCLCFFSCEAFVGLFGGQSYILQMQVLWPPKVGPEESIVVGSGSGLTIELKTNIDKVEAFLEGNRIDPASVFMTTLKRWSKQESMAAMPVRGRTGHYGKIPSYELETITYLDLILPVLLNPGPKKLILVGWLGPNRIEKTVNLICDPDRLDQLARDFTREWWCREGRSLRFRGNLVRWKSQAPALHPYILKVTALLNRWWLGTVDFVEDQLQPDILIKQGDAPLPFSDAQRISDAISSGTISIPIGLANSTEETIVYCLAHEFGHCLGISIAAGIHPARDSFMGSELLNLRWHPYQRRAAYLVYTQPAGTKY